MQALSRGAKSAPTVLGDMPSMKDHDFRFLRPESEYLRAINTVAHDSRLSLLIHILSSCNPSAYPVSTSTTQTCPIFPILKVARILSYYTDGSDLGTVHDQMKTKPDGITIDHQNGFIYLTNMGFTFKSNDGFIERSRLDGSERTTVMSTGTVGIYTPKQITLSRQSRKLYLCAREGMKVMCCNLDGSDVEVLVSTGSSAEDRKDMCRSCVGITAHQKDHKGVSSEPRLIAQHKSRQFLTNSPNLVDLELDESTQTLYWTDRGDPPSGNSPNHFFHRKGVQKLTLLLDPASGLGRVPDPNTNNRSVSYLRWFDLRLFYPPGVDLQSHRMRESTCSSSNGRPTRIAYIRTIIDKDKEMEYYESCWANLRMFLWSWVGQKVHNDPAGTVAPRLRSSPPPGLRHHYIIGFSNAFDAFVLDWLLDNSKPDSWRMSRDDFEVFLSEAQMKDPTNKELLQKLEIERVNVTVVDSSMPTEFDTKDICD
ncbi:alcohol dehydrogenase [Fusarium agapanthi]|uniref:Alcohol dehydrogenase n=1 Tax=Fusarium agapanthi TaxID=1803897 RepID=A0A9P5B4L5_9HYPO|nr:alcohol dehydrogenase [Fusarium agapanthi]